jgi:hypothetical protein
LVEKPVFKKEEAAGVTAKTVDNYITAIGGLKAVQAVKTIYGRTNSYPSSSISSNLYI